MDLPASNDQLQQLMVTSGPPYTLPPSSDPVSATFTSHPSLIYSNDGIVGGAVGGPFMPLYNTSQHQAHYHPGSGGVGGPVVSAAAQPLSIDHLMSLNALTAKMGNMS